MAAAELSQVYTDLAAKYDDPAAIPSLPGIFAFLVTEREASMLLALPGATADVCERTGEPGPFVEDTLLKCFQNGMILYRAAENGDRRYSYVDLYVDSICGDPRNNAHGPEYRALWQQWTREQQARRDAQGEAGFFLPPRVIPEPSADHEHYTVVPLEDAREIIKKSRRRIAQQCPCRFRSPDCGYPKDDICLMFDYMADYFAERGFGKELTMDEALETLQRASQAGLVHLSSEHYYDNSDAGTEYICNCCPCCCAYLESYFASGRTARLVSNYFARVDATVCAGCGVCVSRCHFTAITLSDGHAAVDVSKCVGCSLCAVTCASKAIHIERKPEDQCHDHPHVARHFVEPKE